MIKAKFKIFAHKGLNLNSNFSQKFFRLFTNFSFFSFTFGTFFGGFFPHFCPFFQLFPQLICGHSSGEFLHFFSPLRADFVGKPGPIWWFTLSRGFGARLKGAPLGDLLLLCAEKVGPPLKGGPTPFLREKTRLP